MHVPNAAAQASPAVSETRVRLAEPPQPLTTFELTDQDAERFGLRDLQGRTALIFFGFAHCQSVCPPTMQKLRAVHRALEREGRPVTCVFISVDGERDTPAVLKDYLAPFNPGFVGLTGDPEQVRDIAAAFRAVFFKGMPTDTAGGYDVEHTSQVYLVDREGRLRGTFYNATTDEMADATRTVLRETG